METWRMSHEQRAKYNSIIDRPLDEWDFYAPVDHAPGGVPKYAIAYHRSDRDMSCGIDVISPKWRKEQQNQHTEVKSVEDRLLAAFNEAGYGVPEAPPAPSPVPATDPLLASVAPSQVLRSSPAASYEAFTQQLCQAAFKPSATGDDRIDSRAPSISRYDSPFHASTSSKSPDQNRPNESSRRRSITITELLVKQPSTAAPDSSTENIHSPSLSALPQQCHSGPVSREPTPIRTYQPLFGSAPRHFQQTTASRSPSPSTQVRAPLQSQYVSVSQQAFDQRQAAGNGPDVLPPLQQHREKTDLFTETPGSYATGPWAKPPQQDKPTGSAISTPRPANSSMTPAPSYSHRPVDGRLSPSNLTLRRASTHTIGDRTWNYVPRNTSSDTLRATPNPVPAATRGATPGVTPARSVLVKNNLASKLELPGSKVGEDIPQEIVSIVDRIKALRWREVRPYRVDLKGPEMRDHFNGHGVLWDGSPLYAFRWDERLFSKATWDWMLQVRAMGPRPRVIVTKTPVKEEVKPTLPVETRDDSMDTGLTEETQPDVMNE